MFSRSVLQQTRDYTLRKDVHILGGTTKLGLYINFSTFMFDHFSHSCMLYTTLHAPRAVIYLVPMLIGC